MASTLKDFEASSHLFGANAPFVEELYENYLSDPQSVGDEWRRQFDAWQAGSAKKDVAHSAIVDAFRNLRPSAAAAAPASSAEGGDNKVVKVLQYIRDRKSVV